MSRLVDLTGQRFGRLTVLYRSEKPHPCVYWVCRCNCGNILEAAAGNLKRGRTTDCGCRREEAFIGRRFGRLTVLGKTGETAKRGSRRVPLWECRCDCGNTALVQMDSLTSGTTRSCGCLNEDKLEKMREAAGYVEGTQLSRIRNIRPTAANSSGVVGVYYDKRSKKWRASLKFQGRLHRLGAFDTLEAAAAARKQAEAEWFAPFLEAHGQDPPA